jgi:hypothetical protein
VSGVARPPSTRPRFAMHAVQPADCPPETPAMRTIALLLLALLAAPVQAAPVVYYLHGKFVEENPDDAAHPQHGRYDYTGILAALRRDGATVVSERRPRGTDVSDYADRIVTDIRALLAQGVAAADIAVVGASKGAVIAALVSARLGQNEVAFVLMGACNDWLETTWQPRLRGRVLSIFDADDELARSCTTIAKRSKSLAAFEEIELHTRRGHGFLYRADEVWVAPALKWIAR